MTSIPSNKPLVALLLTEKHSRISNNSHDIKYTKVYSITELLAVIPYSKKLWRIAANLPKFFLPIFTMKHVIIQFVGETKFTQVNVGYYKKRPYGLVALGFFSTFAIMQNHHTGLAATGRAILQSC